jgi:hypothetical protein
MKVFLISIITIFFVVGLFFAAIFYPYFIYLNAISKGISSKFINFPSTDQSLIRMGEFSKKRIKEFIPENEKNWSIFHFSNFEIPFPVENPLIQFYPSTTRMGKFEIFGGSLNRDKNFVYFSFMNGPTFSFDYPLEKQKVFGLPIFKNFLNKIPNEKMFELVFNKDLEIKNLDTSQKVETLQRLWTIPYQELVLNLLILQIRNDLFPKNITSFSWDPDKKLGVVEQPDQNPGYFKETIFLLENNKIYTLEFRTHEGDLVSDNIRFRFLNNLKFKASYPEAFISSYNDYRALPLSKKITPTSFTILYCGLTHDPSNINILIAIVRDLKKGKGNEKYLEWIYSYGKRHLNVDLSIDQAMIDAAKIEKEKAEKLERELREARKLRAPTGRNESEEISKDEKVELFLKDAKEKGEEIEENDKVLIEH